MYNLTHAIKVQGIYDNVTKHLQGRKVYGSKLVYKRKQCMERMVKLGIVTQREYKSWEKTQSWKYMFSWMS